MDLIRLLIGTVIAAAWGIPDGSHWLVVSLVGVAGGGLLFVAGQYMDQNSKESDPGTTPPKMTPVVFVAIGVFLAGLLSILLGPQTSQSFFSLVLAWVLLLGLAAGMVAVGKRRSSSFARARGVR